MFIKCINFFCNKIIQTFRFYSTIVISIYFKKYLQINSRFLKWMLCLYRLINSLSSWFLTTEHSFKKFSCLNYIPILKNFFIQETLLVLKKHEIP